MVDLMAMRVLLVEDDAFLALDLSGLLEQAGFSVIGPATSSVSALTLLAQTGCDVAILDVQLGRQDSSEPVARVLAAQGTPFVTVTGYSHEQRPNVFAHSPVFTKPVCFADLLAALRRCLGVQ
jgi:CheY-like chemotaxis protein